MAKQQNKPNANELWLYFQSVISWVKTTFFKYRKEMKGVDWGILYSGFKDKEFDSVKLAVSGDPAGGNAFARITVEVFTAIGPE